MTHDVSESEMLLELEESTDAIGRRLTSLAADLARTGLEAGGVAEATKAAGRKTIAEQLGAIQRRHTEFRAQLWTYATARAKAGAAP
jgi:hypothetical protein